MSNRTRACTRDCARCGASFSCGMTGGADSTCWCMALPPVAAVPADTAAGCWCRACLEQYIAQSAAAASVTPGAGDDALG